MCAGSRYLFERVELLFAVLCPQCCLWYLQCRLLSAERLFAVLCPQCCLWCLQSILNAVCSAVTTALVDVPIILIAVWCCVHRAGCGVHSVGLSSGGAGERGSCVATEHAKSTRSCHAWSLYLYPACATCPLRYLSVSLYAVQTFKICSRADSLRVSLSTWLQT